MSIQPPNGILDITGATLRVSKMEFSNVTGFDTVLNNVARNTVLHVDTTEYTANVAYAVKPPNMFMAQFDLELAAGGTGLPCNFNYYNDSNLGTSFNGYNLSFNDTSIILTYDGGSALHTATLSSSLNNGVYRKVKVLFDRDTTLVSINGENVFRFKDELRPRTYDTGTTGYIRWWHNSPVARKIKNLKVSNGEKWAQEYDSAGLSSNISYTHGLVGVGTSVPEYTLDVAGDIRASGNLIVNGSNTLINTTSLAIEDGVIECGKGNSSAAKDLGFLMVRNDGSSTTNSNVAMFWDESTDALTFGFSDSGPTATTLTPNTTKTLNSYFVGNVGIGTASPLQTLHVAGNGENPVIYMTDSTNTRYASGMGTHNVTNEGQRLDFYTGDSGANGTSLGSSHIRMSITSTGNVGIGTASPVTPLHISSTNEITTSPAASSVSQMRFGSTNSTVLFGVSSTAGHISAYDTSNFSTKRHLCINADGGNVGIGTTSPNRQLQIYGNSSNFFSFSPAEADDTSIVDNTNFGATSFKKQMMMRLNNRTWYWGIVNNSSNNLGLGADGGGGDDPDIQCVFQNNGTFWTKNIRTSGNVGIGTDNPGIALDVGSSLSNPQIGRNHATGSVHDADKRDAIYFGRWDGTGRDFLGIKCRVDTHSNLGYGSYSNQSKIEFYTWGNNYAASREVMCIRGDGNVGINAPIPSQTFEVAGDAAVIHIYGGADIHNTNDRALYIGGKNNGGSLIQSKCAIVSTPSASYGGAAQYGKNALHFCVGPDANNSTNASKADSRMCIKHNGNVGIGTINPSAGKLDIFVPDGGTGIHIRGGNYGTNNGEAHIRIGGGGASNDNISHHAMITGGHTSAGSSYLSFSTIGSYGAHGNNPVERMRIDQNGNVGIGRYDPAVKLHVQGSGGSTGAVRYFNYSGGMSGTNQYLGNVTLRTSHGILSGDYVAVSSDERIKKNIIDADDAECLDTLRLLKPKKYRYRDEITKGTDPVWGFIAQEVREILPHSTVLQKKTVPNIYELANVSSSNVITFTNFNTADLESNATTVIKSFGPDNKQHDIHLEEVIDAHSIRVKEDLTHLTGSFDAEGNVISEIVTTTVTPEEYEALEDKTGYVANITGYQNANVSISVEEYNALEETSAQNYEQVIQDYTKTITTYPGNQLFVYGQEVDDFVFLKKEAIWTVATAALQEVDRQLQAEKTKTNTLDTELQAEKAKVADLLARVTALENA